MKHSFGPWHQGTSSSSRLKIFQTIPKRKLIAIVENIEDAPLIAAAPDMLECLKFLLTQIPPNEDFAKRKLIQDIIDKAEGKEQK